MTWYTLLVLAAFIIALSHIVAHLALKRFPMELFLVVRNGIGVAVAGPVVLIQARSKPVGVDPQGWPVIALMIVISTALGLCFFAGIRVGSVGLINALRQNAPVLLLLFELLFLQLVIPLPAWVGALIIASGTTLILKGPSQKPSPQAIALGLASAAAYAGLLLTQNAALQYAPIATLILLHAAGLTFTSLLLLLRSPSTRQQLRVLRSPNGRLGLALAAASGLLVVLIFDYLKLTALPHTSPTAVACITLLYLPFSAALGYLLLKQKLSKPQSLAIALVVAGAMLIAATH